MRLFLFLIFFAFSVQAQAQTGGQTLIGGNSTPFSVSNLLKRIGISPLTNQPEEFCLQNNIDKCTLLGYTETECPDGNGLACPFDSSKLNCSIWKCADLNLYDMQPELTECVLADDVLSTYGIACLRCQCEPGAIDLLGCEGKVDNLLNQASHCIEWGYIHLMTDCADYIPCPSDANQVRCLHTSLCEEIVCKNTTTVPAHAIPTYTNMTNCTCGGERKVVTSWTCQEGYLKEGDACVAASCQVGEYEGPSTTLSGVDASHYNLQDCYNQYSNRPGATGAGWVKTNPQDRGLKNKLCYTCACQISNSLCPYTDGAGNNIGAYGRGEDACCDAVYDASGNIQTGAHYQRCVRKCPSDVFVPEHAVGTMSECEACGETTQYISSWYCPASEGYKLSENGTACDILQCPVPENGNYYDLNYNSEADCYKINAVTRINEQGGLDVVAYTEGWEYIPTSDYTSNGQPCHTCRCTLDANDSSYKWTVADSDNQSDAELVGLGCNGKYKSCTVVNTQYVKPLPTHVSEYNSRKICGETYYQIQKCDEGYRIAENNQECLRNDCSDYPIAEGNCPEHGECTSYCTKGDVSSTGGYIKFYMLDRCVDDVSNNIHYKKKYNAQGYAIGCCAETCPQGYELNKTCGAGQQADEVQNGCGETCTKCLVD